MSKAALDTSVVVAALQSWHQDHQAALTCLQSLFAGEEEVVLATRVLVESFSVMTRLPAPYRLESEAGITLLAKTFEERATLIDLPAADYWGLLRAFVAHGASGGAAYDAEIIECSRRAGANRIFTFNTKHFARLAPADVEIVSPYEEPQNTATPDGSSPPLRDSNDH